MENEEKWTNLLVINVTLVSFSFTQSKQRFKKSNDNISEFKSHCFVVFVINI